MSIQNILNQKGTEVLTIGPEATVKNAADLMRQARIAALIVKAGDSIAGIISEREVVTAVSEFGQAALSLPVKTAANRTIIPVAPNDSVKRAMGLMTQHRIRHLPVIWEGELVGIVSIGDIVKSRLQDLETESNVLRDIYFATPFHH